MRIAQKPSATLVKIAAVMAALFALCVLLVGVAVQAQTGQSAELEPGQRLVTIHDQGEKRTVITEANTVGDTLERAGIELSVGDIVEPAASTEFTTTDFTVNIYRAKPIMIVDGMRREQIVSPHVTARDIVKNAETKLYDEDIAEVKMSENPLADGVGAQLIITRATPVNLVLYGEKNTVRTQADTVADLLSEKDITLAADDTLSVPKAASIEEGMTIEVWRNGVQTVTEEQEIEFTVRQIQDADKDPGYKEIKTPGKHGKKSVTYEVTMRNGEEVERKEIQSVELEAPTEQVEVVGAKVARVTGSCGEWMAAAGISHPSAHYLIGKESGCNPRAVNSSSGACGIPQALPCSKMGGVNPDGTSAVSPEGQLLWMESYVQGRYGGWDGAMAHHQRVGWY